MRKRQNFNPKRWGSNAWKFLHLVALGYPTNPSPDDKKTYKEFFWSCGAVLPCEMCCKNYRKHWKKFNIDNYLMSPDSLFEWTVLIRNAVKQMIHQDDRQYYDANEIRINLEKNMEIMDEIGYTVGSYSILFAVFIIFGAGAIPLWFLWKKQ